MPTLISAALVLVSFQAQAQPYTERPGYRYMWGDWGWGHMIFGSLMMILFWGGLILVIVLAVRWMCRGSQHGPVPPSSQKSALDIHERRFAQGEIDKEEFEERRRALGE